MPSERSPDEKDKRRRLVPVFRLGASLAAFLLVGILVITGSRAAFTATTDNTANNWAAGDVAISDDDGGATAMFNALNLGPTDAVENCIVVTYDGSLTTSGVTLYGAETTPGTLDDYLDLTIEIGDGGTFPGLAATQDGEIPCAGFVANSTIYSGTLANFTATATDYASGVGVWTPATNDFKTYRFVVTVQDNPSASGQDTEVAFTWEAQS
jgi:hypothetical protein